MSDSEGAIETEATRTSRRQRNAAQEENDERMKMIEQQRELRRKKVEELRVRLLNEPGADGGDDDSGSGGRGGGSGRLDQYVSYDSMSEYPRDLKPNRMFVDSKRDSLFIPVCGSMVPFHLRTIKNVTKSTEEAKHTFIRFNFHTPGVAFLQSELFPSSTGTGVNPETSKMVYIKELSVRVEDSRNMQTVFRTLKELQKRMKTKDMEAEQQRGVKEQPQLKLAKEKKVVLRDVNVRPQVGTTGRSKAVGTLEAHESGFRFSSSKGEHVDIIYSNIKHAIYQPCENDQLVLIHLHLRDPIIVGKKKTHDIQFFTETRSAGDDLNVRRRAGYDPDEIMEEQREREMIEKLNKLFKGFVKAVEECFLEKLNMDFDIPYRELGFVGTAGKSHVDIFPCRDCIVSLNEWPPFVLTIDEVDIVYFERVSFGLRNFDMVFVYKDFVNSPNPQRISSVPIEQLVPIKTWLGELGLPWYEGPTNMNWNNIVKEILKDKAAFVEAGGWEGWFGDDDEEGDGEGGSDDDDDDDDDSEYVESDSDDEEEDDEEEDEEGGEQGEASGNPDSPSANKVSSKAASRRPAAGDSDEDEDDSDDDDDSSLASESEDGSEGSLASDESEGLDWDELEKKAAKEDRHRTREDEESPDRQKKKSKKH